MAALWPLWVQLQWALTLSPFWIPILAIVIGGVGGHHVFAIIPIVVSGLVIGAGGEGCRAREEGGTCSQGAKLENGDLPYAESPLSFDGFNQSLCTSGQRFWTIPKNSGMRTWCNYAN